MLNIPGGVIVGTILDRSLYLSADNSVVFPELSNPKNKILGGPFIQSCLQIINKD